MVFFSIVSLWDKKGSLLITIIKIILLHMLISEVLDKLNTFYEDIILIYDSNAKPEELQIAEF